MKSNRFFAQVITLFIFCAFLGGNLFTSFSVEAAPLSSMSFLKANGKVLRNNYGSGEVVQLRGTNAGGYMLQEFWMTPTAISTSPYKVTCEKDIYDTLTARFGESNMRDLIKTYQDNYWTTKDFDNCAALGMNCIRLPLWYMNFVDYNGNLISTAFDRVDWFVAEAGKRGIYVIIDMHGAFGSQNGSDHSGIDGGNAKEAASQFFFGSNALSNQQKYYDLWYKIANHYKGNPTVAGYDLLNEPFCTYRYESSYSDDELHSKLWGIYDTAYDVIRSVDPDHVIIMESTWDPIDLPDPATYNWTNVMYEYHNYLYKDYDNALGMQITSMENKLNAIKTQNYNVPSYMGEFCFMTNTNAWEQGLKLLNDAGLSWTNWSYKVTGTNNNWGLYNQSVTAANVATDSFASIKSKWSQVGNSSPNETLINAIKPYFNTDSYPKAVIPNGDYYLTALVNNNVVTADNSGALPLSAIRSGFGGDWEKLTLVNNSDGTISLKSGANGKYICAVADESNQLLARSATIGTWEKFTLYKITADQYGLKAQANGKYVTCDINNSNLLYAKSNSIAGSWETFGLSVVPSAPVPSIPTGKVYLTALANNQVVCADNAGINPLTPNRSTYGGNWEQFTIVKNSDNTYSLLSSANNKYVCAVIDQSKQLLSRSSLIDTWEKFTIEALGNNQYGLKSIANGKYVMADLNNSGILKASSETIDTWEKFIITPCP